MLWIPYFTGKISFNASGFCVLCVNFVHRLCMNFDGFVRMNDAKSAKNRDGSSFVGAL